MNVKILKTILILLLFAPLLFSETPSRGIKIADGYADYPIEQLRSLNDIYFSGDWDRLQKQSLDLLNSLHFTPETPIDAQKNFYAIVFGYKDPEGRNKVLRYILHTPSPEPYVSRLPGIKGGNAKKFYEVFLTADPNNVLVSTYLSTREKNPLESQIPRFVKQFDPKVILGSIEPAVNLKRVYAVLSRIDLPYSRANVTIEDVIQGPEKASDSSKLFNRPLTRFSFGLVSSVIAATSVSNPRVEIQSGKIAEDPVHGHMPMGILNIHPWAYDADAEDPSWKERIRLFVGGILAPEFGISGGVGVQLIRGLSVNTGIGVLLIDTLKDGEKIGFAPVDHENPFEYGTAAVFFIGLGYNF